MVSLDFANIVPGNFVRTPPFMGVLYLVKYILGLLFMLIVFVKQPEREITWGAVRIFLTTDEYQ